MRRGSVHARKRCSHSDGRQLLSPFGLVGLVKEFMCKVHVANVSLWHLSDCVHMRSVVGVRQSFEFVKCRVNAVSESWRLQVFAPF